MDKVNVNIALLLVQLNREALDKWEYLIDSGNFKEYIKNAINLFVDKKLPAAVIAIGEIEQSRIESIKTELKDLKLKIPAEVTIYFRDGSNLRFRFGKKDDSK